jgi:cbb3-type cytochrome oxidase subunit 3
MDKTKPKLVDYNLIDFPKKVITSVQKKIITQDNSKFYFNLLMLAILAIGIYVLYYRNKNKERYNEDNLANILFLNEYINNSLEKSNTNDVKI